MRKYVSQLREMGPYYVMVSFGDGAGYIGGRTTYIRLPFFLAKLWYKISRKDFTCSWYSHGILKPVIHRNHGTWFHTTTNGNSIWRHV